jgi:hypothetical protein
MRRAIALVLALAMAGNGLAMLAAGAWWYGAVPGVIATGPFNPHFVKDIGAAYLVAGLGLAWLGLRPLDATARGSAMAGAAFLVLHAGIHLVEAIGHPAGLADLARDFPGVILPAILATWVAWPPARNPELSHA